ncbi:MAG: hypothetical protein WC717_01005 [Candidatus Micrarchaeia archaeon]
MQKLIMDLDGAPENLRGQRETFLSAYVRLPEYARLLAEEYAIMVKAHSHCGMDPGRVRLYMVGGRIKGSPLCASSDIDLVFRIGTPCRACGVTDKVVKAFKVPELNAQEGENVFDLVMKHALGICLHGMHARIMDYSISLCKRFGIKAADGGTRHLFDLQDWNADYAPSPGILLYDTGRGKKD